MNFWGEDVSSLLVRQEKKEKSYWKGKLAQRMKV